MQTQRALTHGIWFSRRLRLHLWPIGRAVVLTSWFCLFSLQIASAGITGSISGIVTDNSGAVIAGAEVTARNTETGAEQTVKCDSDGRYSFLSLSPGHYDLKVQSGGFKRYQQTGIVIEVNAALRLDVTLRVGGISESVVVSRSAAHVETDPGCVGSCPASPRSPPTTPSVAGDLPRERRAFRR